MASDIKRKYALRDDLRSPLRIFSFHQEQSNLPAIRQRIEKAVQRGRISLEERKRIEDLLVEHSETEAGKEECIPASFPEQIGESDKQLLWRAGILQSQTVHGWIWLLIFLGLGAFCLALLFFAIEGGADRWWGRYVVLAVSAYFTRLLWNKRHKGEWQAAEPWTYFPMFLYYCGAMATIALILLVPLTLLVTVNYAITGEVGQLRSLLGYTLICLLVTVLGFATYRQLRLRRVNQTVVLECPKCGRKNRVADPSRSGVYRCGSCKEVLREPSQNRNAAS